MNKMHFPELNNNTCNNLLTNKIHLKKTNSQTNIKNTVIEMNHHLFMIKHQGRATFKFNTRMMKITTNMITTLLNLLMPKMSNEQFYRKIEIK